jgi:hypothetical protein
VRAPELHGFQMGSESVAHQFWSSRRLRQWRSAVCWNWCQRLLLAMRSMAAAAAAAAAAVVLLVKTITMVRSLVRSVSALYPTPTDPPRDEAVRTIIEKFAAKVAGTRRRRRFSN